MLLIHGFCVILHQGRHHQILWMDPIEASAEYSVQSGRQCCFRCSQSAENTCKYPFCRRIIDITYTCFCCIHSRKPLAPQGLLPIFELFSICEFLGRYLYCLKRISVLFPAECLPVTSRYQLLKDSGMPHHPE